MTDLLKEANATFSELIRIHELNQEMLETLQATMLWLRLYAEKNSIPLPHSSTYNSLINKAEILIEEISQETPLTLTFKKQTKFHMNPKTARDFTEPFQGFWYFIVCLFSMLLFVC